MKIAFIGGGNMGEAIIAAVLEKKLAAPADISVSDVIESRRIFLKKQYGVIATASNLEAVENKDIIVLAVKPQHFPDVLADLKGKVTSSQLVMSIAAGIKIHAISQGLGYQNVVRVMPNTPAQVGFGMSGWTATKAVTSEQKEQARAILAALGREIYFESEDYLDMVTAVSGSGPAYFFRFAEALIDAAVEIGLSHHDAEILVSQTMLGTAQLLLKSGKTPAELRQAVTSKGGTTEKALTTFQEGGFESLVEAAVKAAYLRARELGSGK
jgi:pyrroline-5-carboxylate reductase